MITGGGLPPCKFVSRVLVSHVQRNALKCGFTVHLAGSPHKQDRKLA